MTDPSGNIHPSSPSETPGYAPVCMWSIDYAPGSATMHDYIFFKTSWPGACFNNNMWN